MSKFIRIMLLFFEIVRGACLGKPNLYLAVVPIATFNGQLCLIRGMGSYKPYKISTISLREG